MAFRKDSKKQSTTDSEEEQEEEWVVYLEGELISALDELKKERKKNKLLKKQFQRPEEAM